MFHRRKGSHSTHHLSSCHSEAHIWCLVIHIIFIRFRMSSFAWYSVVDTVITCSTLSLTFGRISLTHWSVKFYMLETSVLFVNCVFHTCELLLSLRVFHSWRVVQFSLLVLIDATDAGGSLGPWLSLLIFHSFCNNYKKILISIQLQYNSTKKGFKNGERNKIWIELKMLKCKLSFDTYSCLWN